MRLYENSTPEFLLCGFLKGFCRIPEEILRFVMQTFVPLQPQGINPGSVSAFLFGDRMEEWSVNNLTLMDNSNQAVINAENNPLNEMLMYFK